MTPDRFADLCEIYGADFRRWPDSERQSALDFAREQPATARAALQAASGLDAALDDFRVAPPSTDLRNAIFAAAPALRRAWWRTNVVWRSVGLAGFGLAGLFAGAMIVCLAMPILTPADDDGGPVVTAFSDDTTLVPDDD